MKRLLFLLVIALLYCNGINSQSKNDIKKRNTNIGYIN